MKYVFGWIFAMLIFFVCALNLAKEDKDKNLEDLKYNHGRMTKIEYQNHSYIGWSCNLGCGIVHDPDCKCKLGEK